MTKIADDSNPSFIYLLSQDSCALNCMEKYLKMNQRISQRFQEFQMLANENAMAMVQKSGKA